MSKRSSQSKATTNDNSNTSKSTKPVRKQDPRITHQMSIADLMSHGLVTTDDIEDMLEGY